MKGLFLAAALLVTGLAHAQTSPGSPDGVLGEPSQFTGHWVGTGVYRRAGVQTFCTSFKMAFEGNKYLMTFAGGSRVCETHSEQFGSVAMAFQNGKLYYNGMEVGSIEGNVLHTAFTAPEGDGRIRHWRMTMRREGDNVVYEESRTMDNEKTPLISFTGILSPEK